MAESLLPQERLALTVARVKAGRGDSVGPGIASELVATIDRLTAESREAEVEASREYAASLAEDPDFARRVDEARAEAADRA